MTSFLSSSDEDETPNINKTKKSFNSPKSNSFLDENGEEIKPILLSKGSPYVTKLSGKAEIFHKIEENTDLTLSKATNSINKSLSFKEKRRAFLAAKTSNLLGHSQNISKIQKVSSDDEMKSSICLSIDEDIYSSSSNEEEERNSTINSNKDKELSTNYHIIDKSSDSLDDDDENSIYNQTKQDYLSYFLSPIKSPVFNKNDQNKPVKQSRNINQIQTNALKQQTNNNNNTKLSKLSKEIESAKSSLQEILYQNDSDYDEYSEPNNLILKNKNKPNDTNKKPVIIPQQQQLESI